MSKKAKETGGEYCWQDGVLFDQGHDWSNIWFHPDGTMRRRCWRCGRVELRAGKDESWKTVYQESGQ